SYLRNTMPSLYERIISSGIFLPISHALRGGENSWAVGLGRVTKASVLATRSVVFRSRSSGAVMTTGVWDDHGRLRPSVGRSSRRALGVFYKLKVAEDGKLSFKEARRLYAQNPSTRSLSEDWVASTPVTDLAGALLSIQLPGTVDYNAIIAAIHAA